MVCFVVAMGTGNGASQADGRRSHKASDTEKCQVAQIRESILREFEFTVISRYFPDYEHEISKRIRP